MRHKKAHSPLHVKQTDAIPICRACTSCKQMIYETYYYHIDATHVWFNCTCNSTGFMSIPKWELCIEHLKPLQRGD